MASTYWPTSHGSPRTIVDGELQADAALIFPDLDARNIRYKIVQALACADATRVCLQEFTHLAVDLSRGAADKVVRTGAILAASRPTAQHKELAATGRPMPPRGPGRHRQPEPAATAPTP